MPLTKRKKKETEEPIVTESTETETIEAKEVEKNNVPAKPRNEKTKPDDSKKEEARKARAALRAISKNTVTITGVVMSTYSASKGVFKVNMATRALGREKSDHPTVTFYGGMATKVQEMLEHAGKFPKVTITGFTQTDKKIIKGKEQYFQGTTGLTFEFAKTVIEQSLNISAGNIMVADANVVALQGELINAFIISPDANSSRARVTVKTDNGRFQFVETTVFSLPKAVSSSLDKGKIIALIGSIQTGQRERNGRKERFETVVCRELALVT
jgi:hypothetical protein